MADAAYQPFPPFNDWARIAVDGASWTDALARLNADREHVTDEQLHRAVGTTMRTAALDTGAIEGLYSTDRGFTFSVATQAAAWEVEMDERGADIRPLFDAQLAAYELILDAATEQTPMSEAFIRRIHEEITAAQKTHRVWTSQGWQDQALAHGQYKTQPNHPWKNDGVAHSYAPVAMTAPEMHRLVTELGSPKFGASHPVIQAAFAHYALVQIHPFADGNGRVARAIASTYLYRAASIPLVIFADQKPAYLDALSRADAGERASFVDFIYERAYSALGRQDEILVASRAPAAAESLAVLGTILNAIGPLTYTELDGRLGAIREAISAELARQIKELTLPVHVSVHYQQPGIATEATDPYRNPVGGNSQSLMMRFALAAPATAHVDRTFHIVAARQPTTRNAMQIRLLPDVKLNLALGDVYPDLSADLRFRIGTVVRGAIDSSLDELLRLGEATLRNSGYKA